MSIIYRYILDLYLSHMFALYILSTNHVLPDIHDGYQSNLVRQAGVLVFPPLINCQTREQNVIVFIPKPAQTIFSGCPKGPSLLISLQRFL